MFEIAAGILIAVAILYFLPELLALGMRLLIIGLAVAGAGAVIFALYYLLGEVPPSFWNVIGIMFLGALGVLGFAAIFAPIFALFLAIWKRPKQGDRDASSRINRRAAKYIACGGAINILLPTAMLAAESLQTGKAIDWDVFPFAVLICTVPVYWITAIVYGYTRVDPSDRPDRPASD